MLSGQVQDALERTAEILTSLVDGSSAQSHANDQALPSLWKNFDSILLRSGEPCTLAVLALAKSGKSTLINALLGQALLPSNNVPETARITAIQHTPSATTPSLSYQAADGQMVLVDGADKIRDHLRQLNSAARGGEQGLLVGEQPLQIAMPAEVLAGMPADALGSCITILDTPGPNEAGEDHLRFKVERLMETVDAVCYILDWSKLKTCEEAEVLQRLHELNPNLLRRLCTRCFFAVNKMDMAESAEGMGEEETREYVAALVTQQLDVPGFELQPEQIFLVSARDALFSRRALRQDASPADLEAFRKIAFGKRWSRVTDPGAIRQEAAEMLAGSGLPELEAGVMGFLGSRATVLHQVALLDNVETLLAQVHNLTSAGAASLHQGVAALSAQIASLQARLADMLPQFEGVREEVQQLEGMVVDEVRERMGRLRGRLEDQINQVLNPNSLPTGAPHGRWPAVWSMAKAIWRLGRGGGGRGTLEEALEGEEGEKQLEMKLSELHSMVYLQIEAEMRDFWHSLEQATNQRQRQLFGAINGRMQELSQAIECEVAGALQCVLEPVDMQLKPPTAEQFHVNLQQLLQRGIQQEVSQEVEEVTREHTMYVKRERQSICKKFEWWEPTTQARTEELRVTRTRYVADVEGIQAYFVGVVEETIANSVRAVRQYVKAYLSGRLAEARSRLAGYAERYTVVMEDALATARLGEVERGEALRVAEARCTAVGDLLEHVHGLQQHAEEMLEGWVDELEAAEEPAAPAVAAVAALAGLQSAPPTLLSTSQLSASGSTAAEVAAAYAAQQVAALEVSMTSLGLDAGAGEAEAAGSGLMAEVMLQEDSSENMQDPAAVAVMAAAASSKERNEDADWTVVPAEADGEAATDAAVAMEEAEEVLLAS